MRKLQRQSFNLMVYKTIGNVQMTLSGNLGQLQKIGPQCVLGVLCLVLFLSVGMMFSNIIIWELNYYK